MNVHEWGCFSIFLRADDVTRTMSKGVVLVKNPVSAPGPPPPFQKSWIRAWYSPSHGAGTTNHDHIQARIQDFLKGGGGEGQGGPLRGEGW